MDPFGIKTVSCIMPIPEPLDLRPYKQNIGQVEVRHESFTLLLIRNAMREGSSNGF